ncbi:hypothetical protein OG828_11795 [Streptomyces sp. NBC_00457]|uniref:hypothetical protein n=1 Tax=Streptomyces sp. NBC_00457 TaxID=2975748 RepID=UPI002E1C8DA5
MDHFERQLAQLMRDTQEHTPYEPKYQDRLRAGVRARRRVRAAQAAVGSVLAVAGLGIGLFLLPDGQVRDEPSAPNPRPAVSPSSPASETSPPGPSPTATSSPSSSPTGSADSYAPTTAPPASAGGATSDSGDPSVGATDNGATGESSPSPTSTQGVPETGEPSAPESSFIGSAD